MSTDTTDPPGLGPAGDVPEPIGGSPSPDPPSSMATIRVADVPAHHPRLSHDTAIRPIDEEGRLRREAGREVDSDETVVRFPDWREELAARLGCGRLIESAPARSALPKVGEVLAGFRLLAELGRGAEGLVFLAVQPSLGDRPVVLKVTPRGCGEHLSLARLQHMNIVPLYSRHVLRDRDLQALCMPFLGGTTLARVLDALKDHPHCRRTGRQLVEALDRLQVSRTDGPPANGPFRRFLARATYVEAVCAIGAALADGLHYAHERELVHMDVKPSNVLLAGDGQPMLLDFHLARSPIVPGRPTSDAVGGTAGFMAPEHRRAIEAVREGRPVPEVVDCRADLYALGMLLYAALGGPVPKSGEAPTVPLRRRNPRVSVGLSDIIDRCLRGDPPDRYPDAAALASDLRRHLADLPLRGVPNRSWAERWRKWRRRHPSALSRRALAVVVLIAAVGAPAATLGIAYRQRLDAAAAALAAGRADLERHRYAEASDALRQGLALIAGLPGFDRPRRGLAEALDRATRAARFDELGGLAEAIRFRYGLAPPPPEDAPALIRLGRKTWEARDALLRGLEGLGDPETDRRVRADLRDLVALWADLLVRYAPADGRDRARREAIGILAEAAERLGPSPSLERERRAYAGEVGSSEIPWRPDREPRTAWEHYDLGRSYLRSGDADLAAEQFRRGLRLRPQDFWLNFYDGLCAYRLGRFEGAVEAFRVCIALAPGTAECYHNRGLAHQALGDVGAAIDDYDRALELDPGLAEALVNRGILRSRRGDHEAAIADLRRAEKTATSASLLRIIRDNLEAVRRARGDRAPAAVDAPAPPKLDDAGGRKSDGPSAPSRGLEGAARAATGQVGSGLRGCRSAC